MPETQSTKKNTPIKHRTTIRDRLVYRTIPDIKQLIEENLVLVPVFLAALIIMGAAIIFIKCVS